MRRYAFVALAASVAACAPQEPAPISYSQQRTEAHESALQVSEALRDTHFHPACGSPAPPAVPTSAVAINAQQSLSCRDLGYMLRRITDHLPAEGKGIVLVLPASDTAAVCAFLRQERVRLPVVAISDSDGRLERVRPIVAFTRQTTGAIASVHFAPTGTELLRVMDAATGSTKPSPPTTK